MNSIQPNVQYNFTGKTVLVTGAGKGIGMRIAECFASAGASSIFHYNHNRESAQEIVQKIEQGGQQTMMIQADITHAESIAAMFDTIERKMGAVDILVNNAGIYPNQKLLEMTPEEWDLTLDTNLKSVFLCTQAAARQMISHQKGGSIVNISSIEGVNPAPGHCHYSSSKAAVDMFTMNAALELGEYGIRVNCVAPGLINSPRLASSWPDGVKRWQENAPLGRLGDPIDIAEACLFFASDAAGWITGARLVVDGGVMTSQIF